MIMKVTPTSQLVWSQVPCTLAIFWGCGQSNVLEFCQLKPGIEIEIGRSRNWPMSNKWCLLFFLLYFFLFFFFLSLFFFYLFFCSFPSSFSSSFSFSFFFSFFCSSSTAQGSSRSERATARATAHAMNPTACAKLVQPTAQQPRLLPRFGSCKLTHEQLCLVGPASLDLNAHNYQSCPTARTHQLWVPVFLPSSRSCQRNAILNGSTSSGGPVTQEEHSRLWRQLQVGHLQKGNPSTATKQSRVCPVCDLQVQITHSDIGCHSSASLPGDPRHHTLKCGAPSAQHPSPCTSCAVMAKYIKVVATPAFARGYLQSAQQDDAENLGIEACEETQWAHGQRQSCAKGPLAT